MGKYTIETDGTTADSIQGYLGFPIEVCGKRTWVKTNMELTPYTDLDAEDFYLRGLNDAWNAARKIDGMKREQQEEIFACDGIQSIALDFSISEIIEKILAYEKKQEGKKLGEIEKVLEATALKCHVSYTDIAKALEKMGVNKND